jgi:hypothetical protein
MIANVSNAAVATVVAVRPQLRGGRKAEKELAKRKKIIFNEHRSVEPAPLS